MTLRRRLVAGLALAAVLPVAGCTGGDPGRAEPAATHPPTRSPADVRADLEAAAARLGEAPLRIRTERLGGGGHSFVLGAMDPTGDDAEMTFEMVKQGKVTRLQLVQVDGDVYLRLDDASDQGWARLGTTDVPADSRLNVLPAGDPVGIRALLRTATEITDEGTGKYRGVLDASRSPNVDAAAIPGYGADPRKVPFTASTDDQGRLTQVVLDLNAAAPGAGTHKFFFYGFGGSYPIRRPTGPVTDAPSSVTSKLGV
ncbi:hypothetical protein ACTMSW_23140 [Micromonospora sp. BQ11]|uniref:hypothetical protein n=1 Tax=Micromonospora sp. BQ11 TaxID=3452212 RepID=UPI003F89737E